MTQQDPKTLIHGLAEQLIYESITRLNLTDEENFNLTGESILDSWRASERKQLLKGA